MKTHRLLWISVLAIAALAIARDASAIEQHRNHRVEHAVAGELAKVDRGAKTIAIKTADGVEETLKFTGRTTVHAVDATGKAVGKAALATELAGKEGEHVVVRYTVEGTEKTATDVRHFGKDTLHESKGVITKVDKAAGTMTVKTEHGTEETYHVAKDAAIDTGHGTVRFAELTDTGGHVVIHYTEDAGRKVGHAFKVVGRAI